MALSPAAVWAELIRTSESVVKQRRSLWQAYVGLDYVPNLPMVDQWTACGLDPETVVADDHTGCQDLEAR